MSTKKVVQNTLNELKNKGYQISSIQLLKGSANSTAYKINTTLESFFLKLYPSEFLELNQFPRFTREINFSLINSLPTKYENKLLL